MNRLGSRALIVFGTLVLAVHADRAALPQQHQHQQPSAETYADAFNKAMHTMHGAMPAQYSGDTDADFARGMIPHHQGAIDMAEVVLKYGKDPAVKKLAEEIKAAQGPEIAQMRAWLDKRGSEKRAISAQAAAGYKDAAEKMHAGMNIKPTDDPDMDFIRGMIPHHQGAIDMANVELRHGSDAELRKLAQAIIEAQQKEIAFMRDWQAAKAKK